MSDRDALKKQAGAQAAAMVEDGNVVGLGTGSTAAFFIDALAARVRGGLKIVGIPTSERSGEQARAGGIEIVTFATHKQIDIAIDGADEITRSGLDLTKGLGGALLREKMVAGAARRLVIIADEGKMVDRLGEHCPIPVEVTPFGWELTSKRLTDLGAQAVRRSAGEKPYLTDGGNYILDCRFAPIDDPGGLDAKIRDIVGVIETGLFVGMAAVALIAGPDGVRHVLPR